MSDTARRYLLIGGGAVVLLAALILMLNTGGDTEPIAPSSSGASGSGEAAPVVAAADPGAAATPGATVATVQSASGGGSSSSSSSAATSASEAREIAALERHVNATLPPTRAINELRPPSVPPTPSAAVASAGADLRTWQRSWNACRAKIKDYRKCDTNGVPGVKLINVSPDGNDFSISHRAGSVTVTLAVVDGVECRATNTAPQQCDAWR